MNKVALYFFQFRSRMLSPIFLYKNNVSILGIFVINRGILEPILIRKPRCSGSVRGTVVMSLAL